MTSLRQPGARLPSSGLVDPVLGQYGNQDEFKHGTLRSTLCNSPRARQPKLLILLNDEVLARHGCFVNLLNKFIEPMWRAAKDLSLIFEG